MASKIDKKLLKLGRSSVSVLPQHKVIKNHHFFIDYQKYCFENEGKIISAYLNKKSSRIYDIKEKYRVINHWDNKGLLLSKRTEDGWRNFSLVDTAWIKLIGELRSLGFPLEKIKKVKKTLFIDPDDLSHPEIKIFNHNKFFEFYVYRVLFCKDQSYVSVLPTGEADIVRKEDLEEHIRRFTLTSRSILNLNSIISSNFPKELLEEIEGKDFNNLNTNEQLLLIDIRMDDYESLTIIPKKGEKYLIKKSKNHLIQDRNKTLEQVRKLLNEGNYQSIVLQQEGGKVVSFKSELAKLT